MVSLSALGLVFPLVSLSALGLVFPLVSLSALGLVLLSVISLSALGLVLPFLGLVISLSLDAGLDLPLDSEETQFPSALSSALPLVASGAAFSFASFSDIFLSQVSVISIMAP